MRKVNYAIVRVPSESMIYGMSSNPTIGTPIYNEALKSHAQYVQTLRNLGVKVHIIPKDENFPDSCFVEDTAILTSKCAVITNPGSPNRNNEKTEVATNVSRYYPLDKIHYIQYPGTLDGGDVVNVNDVFFVGLSQRTNNEGINQLTQIFRQYGFTVIPVIVSNGIHLKDNIAYLENGNLLLTQEFYDNPVFDQFNKIVVPFGEEKAIHSIWVNNAIVLPLGFPQTQAIIQNLNQYNLVNCDVREFEKLDGGLNALSIRF